MTTTKPELVLSHTENAICTITLNRPDKLNSFTRALHAQLMAALKAAQADATVRCIVLTGAGRAFSAGQDLSDMDFTDLPNNPLAPQLADLVGEYFNPLILALQNCRVPIIAAVNGTAAGAGANLALACDIVVAKQSTSFLQAFVNIGLLPDSGGTYFLPRAVGTARALGLSMLGDKLSAQSAKDMGLIWDCVADDAFDAQVQTLAARLAALPTQSLLASRYAIRHSTHSLPEQLQLENTLQTKLAATHDFNEGVQAFLQKRKAVFTGSAA